MDASNPETTATELPPEKPAERKDIKPNGWEIFLIFGYLQSKCPQGFAIAYVPPNDTMPKWQLILSDRATGANFVVQAEPAELPPAFNALLMGFANKANDKRIITPGQMVTSEILDRIK